MRVLSIDTETTGLDYEKHQIVEIGAAVDELDAEKILPLDKVPTFHCYVKRDTYTGSPFALSMHSKIFARIAKEEPPFNYYWPGEAGKEFEKFLRKYIAPDDGKVTVIGKNFASFDLAFLRQDKSFREVTPLFRHRIVDVGLLFLDPIGVLGVNGKADEKLPGTEECMLRSARMVGKSEMLNPDRDKWFGVPNLVEHNALDDALMACHIMRCWWACNPLWKLLPA